MKKKIQYEEYSAKKREKQERFKQMLRSLEWDDSITYSHATNSSSWVRHAKISQLDFAEIDEQIFDSEGMKRVGEDKFYYYYTDDKYFWKLF